MKVCKSTQSRKKNQHKEHPFIHFHIVTIISICPPGFIWLLISFSHILKLIPDKTNISL